MTKQAVSLKTDKDLSDFLTGIFQPHVTALQGIVDKLPEALRPDFLRLKADLDAQLLKLKPTDQVPAALDASYALQGFCNAMERMQEYAVQVTERLSKLATDYASKATAYQGLEEKTKNGELLTKVAATELCDLARKEALASVKPQILAMRKQQVELAGLPMPTDELLGLDEKDFTPLFTAAKANVATLGARGCKMGAKGGGIVKELAWLKTDEFNGRLTNFEDVLGKPSTADPLLGGGGEPDKKTETKAKSRMW